ncbi:MAG: SusD/RagB family nutrient-binding outer membrane lipoprotein [Bacteroidota bacterium]
MKKNRYILLVILLAKLTACEDRLEELFPDPGVYSPTENVVPGLFAQMMGDAAEMRTPFSWFRQVNTYNGIPVRAHIASAAHRLDERYSDYDNHAVSITEIGIQNTYTFASGVFLELATMEEILDGMNETDRMDNILYLYMIRIMRLNRYSKAVDMYNSIPYFDAGKASEGVFFPAFDDPWEIYQDIMVEYKELADAIAAINVSTLSTRAQQLLPTYDILFKGDTQKWVQLANVWRLRAAIRVSDVYPTEAGAIISEIVADGNLPTTDLIGPSDEGWITIVNGGTYKGNFSRWNYNTQMSPEILYWLDADQDHIYTEGVDDPRLPALALPNREGLYIPMTYDSRIGGAVEDAVTALNQAEFGYNFFQWTGNDRYNDPATHMDRDAITHWNNYSIINIAEPYRLFTRTEVELILAEAVMKGLVNTGASARDHIENAVRSSINFWYTQNEIGESTNAATSFDVLQVDDYNGKGVNFYNMIFPERPNTTVIEDWASKIGQDFDDALDNEAKLEIIMQQKYIDLNVAESLELFSELRRTRHPTLGKFIHTDGTSREDNRMVERFPYNSQAEAFNSDQLDAVQDQNNTSTPIFWVPESKHNVFPYVDNDLYYFNRYPGIPETFN